MWQDLTTHGLLCDYEAAGDALQIRLPVLPDPRGGLVVTQAIRYILGCLVVQHARLPRLLDGFQPVEYGRRDLDRVLESPRHALLLFLLPQEILTPSG
jgi:hypothetical protein